MVEREWLVATLKQDFLRLKQGTTVVICQSAIVHADVRQTWWMLEPYSRTAYQVSEQFFGRRLLALCRVERVSRNPEQCTQRLKECLKGTPFDPKNAAHIAALRARSKA